MITPTVHEVPIAGTSRPAPLRRYEVEVLDRMEQMLRARPCLRDDERASLTMIERERRERRDRRRRGCR